MILRDFHIHSSFSDGEASPEEIIKAAISAGLTHIGISDHSYTYFDEEPCRNMKDMDKYIGEINALKEKYKNKIKVYCGIEQDYYSDGPDKRLDYVIGSVHYLELGGKFVCIDYGVERLKNAVNDYFGGDIYSLIEEYYRVIGDIVSKTNADIIGHFDIISKYNEKYHLFDENNERYRAAWKKAVDKLLKANAIFEINTGAISRGHRHQPYPSDEIRDYIAKNGGKFVLSSDSHHIKDICAEFKKFELHQNSCKFQPDML
ncbi:MAG: histidinol-phosphatase [Clostridiales bacterium]|nr:histidinol-phosphatase [Candidatus Equinaster intestinalis]